MKAFMIWAEANQEKHKRMNSYRQNNPFDEEWSLIQPIIPAQGRMGRTRKTDLRPVLSVVFQKRGILAIRRTFRRAEFALRSLPDRLFHRFEGRLRVFGHRIGAEPL